MSRAVDLLEKENDHLRGDIKMLEGMLKWHNNGEATKYYEKCIADLEHELRSARALAAFYRTEAHPPQGDSV